MSLSLPKALDRALERGWSIIPVGLDKKPLIGSWKKYQTERPTREQVAAWKKDLNPPAWAVITGALSGIVILDFDGAPGAASLERLALAPHVRTGSGGSHCYAPHPGYPVPTLNSKAKKELGRLWPGCDIRGDGGYAVFTGRNSKGAYEWLAAPEAAPVDIAALDPQYRALVGLVPPGEQAPVTTDPSAGFTEQLKKWTRGLPQDSRAEIGWLIDQALSRAPADGRNNCGFWLATQLRDNGYSEADAGHAMSTYQSRCAPTNTKGQREPYTDADARKSLTAAFSKAPRAPIERGYGRTPAEPPAPPSPAPEASPEPSTPAAVSDPEPEPEPSQLEQRYRCTDLGNAERFEQRNGANVRYSKVMDRWFLWDGKRYQPDERLAVMELAATTIRAIYQSKEAEGDGRESVLKHAMKSESRGALAAMVDLARSRRAIAIIPGDLDVDPYLLNCKNGTLDLRTGKLREHRRADLMTKLSPTRYEPAAPCPHWLEFLKLIMGDDPELIGFLQRAVGYSLTGDTSERVLLFAYGSGRNGKSTFLETIHMLAGDYGLKTPSETLMWKPSGGINNDVARLKGARYVYASETTEGGKLNEEAVKNLTGETYLAARFLYSEIFEFRREFKLWFASNHRPSIRGGDRGIWDRVKEIPFTVRIPDEALIARAEVDRRFKAELPGILAWAVAGCREYLEHGLRPPRAVEQATENYRADMDTLGQFIEECCNISTHLESRATPLYAAYAKWSESRGERYPLKQTAFGLRLQERGFQKGHRKNGNFYAGLALSGEGFEGCEGIFDKLPSSKSSRGTLSENPSTLHQPFTFEENKGTYGPDDEVEG